MDCPKCGAIPIVVWMPGGAFYQRTECQCGRKTRWVACGHDAAADASDDEVEVTLFTEIKQFLESIDTNTSLTSVQDGARKLLGEMRKRDD